MIDLIKIKGLCKQGKFRAYTKIQWTQNGKMRFIYLEDVGNGETVCLGKEKMEGSFEFIGVEE